MANLTITIDDETLERARLRALELGTSVNAILAEHLRAFAAERATQGRALQALVALADDNERRGGRERAGARSGRDWSREDLQER
ncbi:MAG: hypothetical protein IT385_10125 [Deltaproteobacteria bacterium]|nr:hypothetical protein [Deltaproteobacteria bacterium]